MGVGLGSGSSVGMTSAGLGVPEQGGPSRKGAVSPGQRSRYASIGMAATPFGGSKANSAAGCSPNSIFVTSVVLMDAGDGVAGVVDVLLADAQDQAGFIVDPDLLAGTGEMVGGAPGHGVGADVSPACRPVPLPASLESRVTSQPDPPPEVRPEREEGCQTRGSSPLASSCSTHTVFARRSASDRSRCR